MKWYFWILIFVVVLIIIFIIRYKMTNKKPSKLETQILNGDYGDILNDNISPQVYFYRSPTGQCMNNGYPQPEQNCIKAGI